MTRFFDRLREPSTMAGLGMLAGLFGVPAGTVGLATQIVVSIAGLAAVVMPEKSGG